MAEAEEWVQQDGEWQCCNCEELFFNGKPKGYDFDHGAVKVIPEGLSPFWQERKYCQWCWGAWMEGFEECKRLRHNADNLFTYLLK